VVVAPARGRRPGVPRGSALEDDGAACPFCEGHEAETPPETYAVGPAGRAPDTPGWSVRVFPNLYPAFVDEPPPVEPTAPFAAVPARGRQEVAAHSPRHVLSIADLSDGEIRDVAVAWRARADAARDAGFSYLHALVNEGRAAGASRAHSHSQLIWLPHAPQAPSPSAPAECAMCALLVAERRDGTRVVAERDGLLALCPFASRAPYELMIAPLRCEPDAYASELLAPALSLAAEALRRLRRAAGPVSLNLWLETGELGSDRGHWRLVLLPRLTVFAGIELGAGIFVNPLPPEDAAPALRGP
jgi:UDPglucose--hexose-1-phosphate uridylyltransferase